MLKRLLIRPVAWSVVAVAFAAVVAAFAYWALIRNFGFGLGCGGPTTQGKHLVFALGLVGYGGIVEVALILSARRRRQLLAAVIVLGVVGLCIAIELVALDKATYTVQRTRNSAAPYQGCEPHHAVYLYPLWGLSLAVLLVQGLALVLGGQHLRGSDE